MEPRRRRLRPPSIEEAGSQPGSGGGRSSIVPTEQLCAALSHALADVRAAIVVVETCLAAKYRLLLLGQAASEGSFSLVYRAQHVDSGREVVIKKLKGAKFNARQVKSFAREVDKMKLLHHPSIPAIFDHSAQDMMAMIVMPFVPGRTAQAAMDDNESDAALSLGLPVLGAAQAKPSGRPCTW